MSISLKNDAGTFSTNLNQSNPTANVDITLPTTSGTMALTENKLVLGTAVTASGTSVDFTGIPSWAKRITIMFNGVSTNGTSPKIVQIGNTTLTTSGYISGHGYGGSASGGSNTTTGFGLGGTSVSDVFSAQMIIANINGFSYNSAHSGGFSSTAYNMNGGGNVTLSATLDRIRITTVNGTDTFDAGTINVMWE